MDTDGDCTVESLRCLIVTIYNQVIRWGCNHTKNSFYDYNLTLLGTLKVTPLKFLNA